jgi:hypothetical protein
MRTVVVFFLFLCLHLLSGSTFASSNDYSGKYNLLVQNLQHLQPVETVNQFGRVSKNEDSQEEKIDVLSFEDDEDITRKLLSFTRYFAAFWYVFILAYAYSISFSRGSFYHLFPISSRKYILQRVLRI